MSNRTIVEFNHDLARRIDEDPEGFVAAVRQMLNSGVNCNPKNTRGVALEDMLAGFGVRVSPTHHHSDGAEVVLSTERGREYFRLNFT